MFDGYNFTAFRFDPADNQSISNSNICDIYVDKKDNIWLATYGGGLNKFDKGMKKFSRYLIFSDSSHYNYDDNIITKISPIDKENLLLGTYGCGLVKFNTKSLKMEMLNQPYKEGRKNHTTCLLKFTERIYLIGTERGIYFFDVIDNKEVGAKIPTYLQNKIILSTMKTSDGRILLSTFPGKLFIIEAETGNNIIVTAKEILNQNVPIYNVYRYYGNEYMIASNNFLSLHDIRNNKVVYKNELKDIIGPKNAYRVKCFFKDKSGVLWFGTSGRGLAKITFNRNKFTYLSPVEKFKINNNSIWAIFSDSKGLLWIGTECEGLIKYDRQNNSYKIFKHDEYNQQSISSNSISTILEDIEGDLWVATYGGGLNLMRKDGSFKRFLHDPLNSNSISHNYIWTMMEDSGGKIWIGSKNGIDVLDKRTNSFQHYSHNSADPKSLSNNAVLTIYEDSDNTIWVGTYGGGLCRYNEAKNNFTVYEKDLSDPASLSDNSIMSILEDSCSYLWIGTDIGLNRFDKMTGKVNRFFEKNGLPNNVIYGITGDKNGYLWLSTNKGISKLDPQKFTFKNYDNKDGLQSNEFNQGAYYTSKEGKMFFGGVNGLNVIHPDNMRYNTHIPNVVITEIKLMNKRIAEAPILSSGVLEISYSQNFISFQFAALDFTSPQKNQYKYKMEGFDKNWIDSEGKRFVDYTNLDPGKYKFKVIASNNDGMWNMTGTSLAIVVLPPYWMTWWFRMVVIGVLISIAGYAYRRRVSNLKKGTIAQQRFSQQLIDSQENERKRMASELHDGLGQNLLIINNRAKIALKKSDFDSAKTQMESISEIALESINDVRKIAYNLHPYHLDELGLTKTAQSIINKSFETTGIHVSHSINYVDSIFKPESEIHIFRIIQEGISNIIKHSAAKNVNITVTKKSDQVIINLTDDGKGMSKEFVEHSLKNSAGFGLKGMHERVRLINGSLQINSIEEKGTTLLITIPIELNNEEEY
ncbi:MAG: two-component regulator propeller domain-containing protein [Ignavibacteriaceae bacterium]|jgi:signal transduction histidine kinase/ligand-binding sensor domain-containing protein